MTDHAELLKTAASEIDRLTAEVSRLQGENVTMAQSIKTASEKQKKTAADMGALAGQAAKVCLENGLVKSAQAADELAAAILGQHAEALHTIAKIASLHSSAPKLGSVFLDESSNRPETSNEVWERRIAVHVK